MRRSEKPHPPPAVTFPDQEMATEKDLKGSSPVSLFLYSLCDSLPVGSMLYLYLYSGIDHDPVVKQENPGENELTHVLATTKNVAKFNFPRTTSDSTSVKSWFRY
jgi:hypothetical protein